MAYDVLVIGAGPAGASAALFLAKAGKQVAMFDADQGMTKRAWVLNHYGIDEIEGPELVDIGKRQATKFGTEIIESKVTDIKKTADGFDAVTENGQTYHGTHVILATGLWADLAETVGLQTKPATEPRIKTIVDVDAQGKTNIDGIWAAGTVAGVSVHTIITAGDGAKVAINLLSEINGERYVDHDFHKPTNS